MISAHRRLNRITLAAALACVFTTGSRAVSAAPVSIPVPNGSFESPVTSYVSTNIDNWQKNAKPSWYMESGGFLWTQLTGLFKNTPVTSTTDHLDNCDGQNAMWLFAVPEVALFQDYDSVDWNDAAPVHAFNAKFDLGSSYDLAVAINGGGGNMLPGVELQLSLYYKDASGNKVTVVSTTVVNSLTTFPNHTHLVDFHVTTPVVKPGDAWAGKNIGIQFLSLATPQASGGNEGGYWDLDNVRLTAVPGPPFPMTFTKNGTNWRLGWPSVAGFNYQVSTSTNLTTWTASGAALPGTGAELSKQYAVTGTIPFYRVQVTKSP